MPTLRFKQESLGKESFIYYINFSNINIYHSKLKTELFTVAVHKGLNKNQVSPTRTVMSGKFGLVSGKKSGKCQGILFCPVCMNPDLNDVT